MPMHKRNPMSPFLNPGPSRKWPKFCSTSNIAAFLILSVDYGLQASCCSCLQASCCCTSCASMSWKKRLKLLTGLTSLMRLPRMKSFWWLQLRLWMTRIRKMALLCEILRQSLKEISRRHYSIAPRIQSTSRSVAVGHRLKRPSWSVGAQNLFEVRLQRCDY